MPRPARYPFGNLTVGATAVISDVPSRNTLHVAKNGFMRRLVRDLGYREGWDAPSFSITYDRATRVATITRLRDGAEVPRKRTPRPDSRAATRRQYHADTDRLANDIQAFLEADRRLGEAGLPHPPITELVERCQALSVPSFAKHLADRLLLNRGISPDEPERQPSAPSDTTRPVGVNPSPALTGAN